MRASSWDQDAHGQMTFDEAVEFFVKEGYQVRPVAEKEAKRGTSDPTYLVYTLGKLQILKLREDYKKKKGAQFSLQNSTILSSSKAHRRSRLCAGRC